jgi:predicted enzyme related to lactoylglutathione lyase
MADTATALGIPIWTDLGTPDVNASRRFYGEIFGWTSEEGDPQFGGYTMFHSNGKMVAGVGPLMSPQQPPAWTTYIGTNDADATAAKITAAGGTMMVAPMDVGDAGRMAILMDPTGAALGLWQPGQHKGAEIFNVPVAMSWNELATRDVEAAKRFYHQVFGWDPRTSGEGAQSYTEWQVNDRSIGGMMPMPEQVPAAVPPYWMTYFAVADCKATVEKATQLGGQVTLPPMDIPQGTFAVLSDPAGATFAVIQLAG